MSDLPDVEPRVCAAVPERPPMTTPESSRDVVELGPAASRSPMRKRQMGLTEEERRILLAELAEIAAELDELQERTAEIAARVAPRSSIHLARPA
jgi:hypothetical protein